MDMQAIRIHEYGTPEVMKLEALPLPLPGADEALVRVEAASVNFLDVQFRRGDLVKQDYYSREAQLEDALPKTIGSQGVGTIEAVGSDVRHVKVGDRVNFYGSSYATHALVPANRLVPVPPSLSLEQAAAGLTQGFIAYELTNLAYPVKEGDWCLIQAAAGGIGQLLCQMAKIRGGRVIGVTSTSEKAQIAREAGADETIISGNGNIAQEARRISGGRGVNVVYDGVGKDTFEAGLDSLAPHGYMMVYGQASGFVPPIDIMTLQDKGSLFLSRNSAGFYFEEWGNYLPNFVSWVQEGKLSIHIDRVYPLADAAQAHAAFEQRRTAGRILLFP